MEYHMDEPLQELTMDLEEKFRMRNTVTTEYLMEAIAYLRYSSHKQDGGISLEYQINEVLEYAARNKIKIVGWYIDAAKSATEVAGRDNFLLLFDNVERGKVPPNVIIFATNRAFRNNGESFQYRTILRNKGITLHSATQNIDESTSSGRMHVNMLATIDQYQSETISDFVSAATRYLITEGFSAGGMPPYGYKSVPVIFNGKERMQLVPHEPEAVIVREIFEKLAAGKNINQLVKDFKERGIKTRNGNVFSWDTIRHMTKNIIYKGARMYKMKSGKTAYTDNYCTPLISAELFDAVTEKYKPSDQPKGRERKRIYPLTGKINCSCCGKAFTATVSNRWKYYACQGRRRLYNCEVKGIQTDILEKMAFDAVKEHILSDKAIEEITKTVLKQIKKAPAAAEEKRKLESRKNTLEKEIAEIVQMKLKNQITESVMAMMIGDKNTEISSINRKLAEYKMSADTSINAEYIKNRIKSIFDPNAFFEECSPEMRKELFNQTIKKIEANNTQVVIHLRIDLLANTHKSERGLSCFELCVKNEIGGKKKRGQ